jgi:hypothetical protein
VAITYILSTLCQEYTLKPVKVCLGTHLLVGRVQIFIDN